MDQELFNRKASVQMGTIAIEGLRVQFKVEKNNDDAPNSAEVTVWNLARPTRERMLAAKSVPIMLNAGYGDEMSLLFMGDILPLGISVARQGPDWLTTFKAGDGLDSMRSDRISIKVPAGADFKKTLMDLLGQFKKTDTKDAAAKISNGVTVLSDAITKFASGTVLSGGATTELNRLLKPSGLRASVQNGKMDISPIAGFVREVMVPALSPSTGLIGSPEPTKDGFVKFKALLRPQINVSRQVKITCESHPSGIFVTVHRLTHIGDTRGQEWYTEIEGKIE